jgi:hypothetical protein
MRKKKADYEVGFKKPPKHTRFKKGQSGNPAGRPKQTSKVTDVSSILAEELGAKVTINDTGERITKAQAVIRQIVNQAAKGNPVFARLLLKAITVISATSGQEPHAVERSTQELEAELDAMLTQIGAKLERSDDVKGVDENVS